VRENGTLIEITELRAIGSDGNGWQVLKRTKKRDKDTKQPSGGYSDWVPYKYPVNFGRAAWLLEEEMIRTCGATTLTELRRSAERIHQMMLEIIKKGELL
jgi:hypothetical protein